MNCRRTIFFMSLILGILIFSYPNTIQASQNYEAHQILTPGVMQEDLQYLEQIIKEIHPFPYNSITKPRKKTL